MLFERGSLLSAAADVLCQPVELMPILSLDYQVHTGKNKRAVRVLWVSRVLLLVGLTCLLERVRIPRGGLPGTRSGIRERCMLHVLSHVLLLHGVIYA